jgi:CubicO group peptidase (beta-lactamase class C family)
MEDLSIKATDYDFSALQGAMRRYIDQQILPCVSYALMQGRDVVDTGCLGWADKEADVQLRPDHIFRVFSNTKLITSCAAMLLFEEERFKLDDPIDDYIPPLANRKVLRPGATSLNDVEPARGPITIRHLMSHSAGLSYGLLDPGTLIFKAYTEKEVLTPYSSVAEIMDILAGLPLVFHPGTSWEYSVATDVIGRLVEVLSGHSLQTFIQARILDPLGMVDTAFSLPEEKHQRLTRYYAGADLMDPLKPGLTRTDEAPYPGAYLKSFARQAGGSGLVSTLPDMVALLRSLLPGGETLLKPETIALMATNQLPDGVNIKFPQIGEIRGKGTGWRAPSRWRRYHPIRQARRASSNGVGLPVPTGGFLLGRTLQVS